MMRKLLTLAAVLCLAGCAGRKGLTEEQQAETDRRIAQLKEQLAEKAWVSEAQPEMMYIFHTDGSLERILDSSYVHRLEDRVTEAGNWHIGFTNELESMNLSECRPEKIEQYFDYFLHFDGWNNMHEHHKIRFDDSGRLWLWDEPYREGPAIPDSVPADAGIDPEFAGYVWHVEEDGSAMQWLMYEDGVGIETFGMVLGEMIDPAGFHWSVKDDTLYLNWNWDNPGSCRLTDEYGIEYIMLERFTIEKGAENGLPRYTLHAVWPQGKTLILTPSTDFNLTQEYEDMLTGRR